ncbi:MAG: hypothetical protein FJW37_07825, partial [Acidobacteria bacterium]|nr:hypothetical protein [Acidobacteriota bacterium]
GDFASWVGGGQAVLRDSARRVNYGASDPRKDGAAAPEPEPYFAPPKAAAGRERPGPSSSPDRL